MTYEIDATDRKILGALAEDGAMTAAALGDRVGLSPSAAHRRVKLMEAAGVIQGYRARLSRAARGDPSTVFVLVTLKEMEPRYRAHTQRVLAKRAVAQQRTASREPAVAGARTATAVGEQRPAENVDQDVAALAGAAPKVGTRPSGKRSGGARSGGSRSGGRGGRPGGGKRH